MKFNLILQHNVIVKPHHEQDIMSFLLPEAEVLITKILYKCKWGLTGAYPMHNFYSANLISRH